MIGILDLSAMIFSSSNIDSLFCFSANWSEAGVERGIFLEENSQDTSTF